MASLTPHSGSLGIRLAAHLLRRATYKTTASRIETFANYTPQQAINKLFEIKPLKYPNGPLSWVSNAPMFDIATYNGGVYEEVNVNQRGVFTHAWRFYESMEDDTIRWKIVHWFASIYSLKKGGNGQVYHFWRLLENRTFQDLKSLAKKVTVDNEMLRYLNNNDNVATGPNENYAREFMELFTILRGPNISVGNYTNYTEADIATAARVLTGFKNSNTAVDTETGILKGRAVYNQHDKADKKFSSAFQNQTIQAASNANDMFRELSDFVDMIFNQDATALSYIRKMYRYFVADNISEEVEQDIISPLAIELKDNGYQHIPILKKLLTSQHFYDMDDEDASNEIIGGKLKSPYEMLFQSITTFGLVNRRANNLEWRFYKDYIPYRAHTRDIGLDPLGPDTVEGYAGFYKEPGYSRNWFSNNLLFKRFSFGTSLIRGKRFNENGYFPFKIDIVRWAIDHLDLPNYPGTPTTPIGVSDADYTVDKLLSYLLPEKPTGSRYDYFKESLLGGLSPINWYFAWKNFRSGEMDDSDVRVGLERLFTTIMSAPEYQTF
ncbi:MAG: DUF1800 family protein [Saprospiraceae bacterium]